MAAGGAVGTYIIIYTGSKEEGTMSVSDFQVYVAETNAAANKQVSAPGGGNSLQVLTDPDADTCATVAADPAADGQGTRPLPAAAALRLRRVFGALSACRTSRRDWHVRRQPALSFPHPCLLNPLPAATVSVDLGYTATVGAVAVRAGPGVPSGTVARVFIQASEDQGLQDAPACNTSGLLLQPGAWSAVACNVTGR